MNPVRIDGWVERYSRARWPSFDAWIGRLRDLRGCGYAVEALASSRGSAVAVVCNRAALR